MADERVWGFRNRRQQNPSSSAKARARNQGVQMRKKNSRQRLFQTRETLSSSASAVNAYGRLKIQEIRRVSVFRRSRRMGSSPARPGRAFALKSAAQSNPPPPLHHK